MRLVIVESPAKAKTLERYLGDGFQVEASKGHVRDLPEKRIGVKVDRDFEPEYEVTPGREKIVAHLKKLAKKAECVYLAPDPDREGEAIAWHIAQLLEAEDKCFRATFNEVTRRAVVEAIQNPGRLNQNLIDAQQARRILDRLVGYKISPLLGRQMRWGLSAGRVQSVAVRLVVERERQIRAFTPEEYWLIEALARAKEPPPFTLKLSAIQGKKAEVHNAEEAGRVVAAVEGKPFFVTHVEKRDSQRRPSPPFITSTLQQEAARKLRMTTTRTMSIAQTLYEGVELGEAGLVGLITYMRTDSVRLSAEAVEGARRYVTEVYGADYLPERPAVYKSRKGAQEAHEAIRPTDLQWTPERVAPFLDKGQLQLYRLIWNRFIASQMAPAKIEQTRVEASPDGGAHVFAATGQIIRFPGFLALYEEGRDEDEKPESGEDSAAEGAAEKKDLRLPPVEVGERLAIESVTPLQKFTQPPPRFNEASLVRELESNGIGRPSTYASIVSTIQTKKYVRKDKGRFVPTQVGETVTDLLIASFPEILDVGFTAHMESELDEIEQGSMEWRTVLKEFYEKFAVRLKEAEEHIRAKKRESQETDQVCPACGAPMVIRMGRHGRFLSCSRYPECKTAMSFDIGPDGAIRPRESAPRPERIVTDIPCPKCSKPMVIRTSKRGPFLGCSQFPRCRCIEPLPEELKQKHFPEAPKE